MVFLFLVNCRTVLGRGVTVLFTGREGTLVLVARYTVSQCLYWTKFVLHYTV